MILIYPFILTLLVPLILLFFYFFKYNEVKIKIISNSSLYYFFLALLFLILASTNPAIKKEKQTIVEQKNTLIIALDASNSMFAEDLKPNRYGYAVSTIESLLDKAPDFKLGLIAFSDNTYSIVPPTSDFASFKMLLKSINLENISNGTSFLELLQGSKIFFNKNTSTNNLLIISDGSDKNDFTEEVKFAQENNVKIFIIEVASSQPSPIPYKDSYIKDTNNKIVFVTKNKNLSQLSEVTGGLYVEYPFSIDEIKQLLNVIRNNSVQSEDVTKTQQYIYLFYFPLFIAFIFIYLIFFNIPHFKNFKILALLSILLFPSVQKAGVLDFIYLESATNEFKNGNYQKAIDGYLKTAKNDEILFNIATSYYMLKNYKKALEIYNKIRTKDQYLMFKKFYNMGNSAFYLNDYYLAKQYFTIAAKLKKDINAIENLEKVNTLLMHDNYKYNVEEGANKKAIYVCVRPNNNKKNPESGSTSNSNYISNENSNKESNKKETSKNIKKKPNERDIKLEQPNKNLERNKDEISW